MFCALPLHCRRKLQCSTASAIVPSQAVHDTQAAVSLFWNNTYSNDLPRISDVAPLLDLRCGLSEVRPSTSFETTVKPIGLLDWLTGSFLVHKHSRGSRSPVPDIGIGRRYVDMIGFFQRH